MNLTFALFAVLGFLAVFLLFEGLYNLWSSKNSAQARRIANRLSTLDGGDLAEVSIERAVEQNSMPWLHALLMRHAAGQRLVTHVRGAGMKLVATELLVLSGCLFTVGVLVALLIGRPLVFGCGVGLVLGTWPWMSVNSRRQKRIGRFEQQLPEALDLMSRAMRAGHAFPTTIKMCAEELAEPMGREFRVLSDEINYGVPLAQALHNLSERVPIADMSYFAVAVLIQRDSGGNMAELLDSISSIVRQRLKFQGHVRTLSAEGRMSAWILTLLPFGTGLLINLINPGFMDVLWTDPMGVRIVSVSLGLLVLGVFWMRKVIRIRV